MEKILNKEVFYVNEDEFQHKKYLNLDLCPELGIFEREIGLIKDIIEMCKQVKEEPMFINFGLSHGGYLPIKVSANYIVTQDQIQISNLKKNLRTHIHVISDIDEIEHTNKIKILRCNSDNIEDIMNYIHKNDNNIILSYTSLNVKRTKKYNLSKSNLIIYIPDILIDLFEDNFRPYLLDNDVLEYDNLIHLCMIVKDASDGFREILEKNLPFIDKWTILDTGSTDNTVNIIKDVLKNKKGKLFEEPFINYRESRNRCLELAGDSCKFTIMLDDTYILQKNTREYLELIRTDQLADSYNIFIKGDDNMYGSNRIIKTDRKLRYIYKIHEIINNINNLIVQLPHEEISIVDISSEYMRKRTLDRKESDLKLLFESIEENPDDPRPLYYISATYISLEDWEKCFEYSMKRINHPVEGYREEVTESYLRCSNIAETEFKWEWEKCEELYLKCYNHDPSRSDALYSIGLYYLNNNNFSKAYDYFKRGFELGVPTEATSNLRYNIYNTLIPLNLAYICYQVSDHQLGQIACEKYLKLNPYNEVIISWLNIFKLLNLVPKHTNKKYSNRKILCFVADGGFKPWSGSSINKEGVGGSETFVIEMSRKIAILTNFDVYVFCRTEKDEVFENVKYKNINNYVNFLIKYNIHTCIISRFSEYVPVSINNADNVYLFLDDLTPSGNIIPINDKLRGIFCKTDWHKEYFLNIFPSMKDRTYVFPNGINIDKYPINPVKKVNSFIYSSFPNRGLIVLLKMFTKIREKIPDAILNVFCDLNNSYVQDVAKDEISQIEKLLEEHKNYVTNHGWVSKDVLTKYYLESDIWLYPCTFKETFCTTALEAAACCTLAITNDLAGLQTTVGDRGIIIPGDATTEEWQEKAINELIHHDKKNDLVSKNRKWAEEHDWMKLAQNMVDNYIGLGSSNNELKKYYEPIQENYDYLCEKFSHCKKVLEIGPGKTPFPLSTHFVDYINNGLNNLYVMDITKNKLPFKDDEFDLVYCRHTLEDIHNPDFVFNELVRVAKLGYIETPSPIAETTKYIDLPHNNCKGYLHHRYLIWEHNNILKCLPKYPAIEHIDFDYSKKIENPYYWNTYFTWNKNMIIPEIKMLQYDIDYYIQNEYEKMIRIAIDESKKSIKSYINEIRMTQEKIIYADMLNWSSDIPTGSKKIFEEILDRFKDKRCHILEIGTYVGTSIISMLKYLPDSYSTVIDLWENYEESDLMISIKRNKIEEIFNNNLAIANVKERVLTMKGNSREVLMKLLKSQEKYDFIYVDGSHRCLDFYSDMILSWELLSSGGVLGIDDYLWGSEREILDRPYHAIKYFMEQYQNFYTILHIGYRVFLLKN